MVWKVALIVLFCLVGVFGLNIFPPWTLDGIYRGHSSVFSTAFMKVDHQLLFWEQAAILFVTVVALVLVVRRKN